MSNQTPLAAYEAAVAAMKAARRMLFADLGMGFDEKLDGGTYASLAGDERCTCDIDFHIGREWRVFLRVNPERMTLEVAGVGGNEGYVTFGRIDSMRLDNGQLCAFVVESEGDDFGGIDLALVILSPDKEAKP